MNANGKTGLSGLTSRRCACIRVMLAFACMVCALPLQAAWQAGLKGGSVAGERNLTAYPAVTNVYLSPHAAATTASPPWAAATTWVYWGQMYFNGGTYHFAENIDDSTWLKIGDTVYINDAVWNAPVKSGNVLLAEGWHPIEMRFGNGGGGAGPVGGSGWTATKGFGYNIDGPDTNQGGDYAFPLDNGAMSLFRYDDGTGFGSPEAATYAATDVALSTAKLNGGLISTGQSDTAVILYWGESDGADDAGAWAHTNVWDAPQVPGAFSYTATELSMATTYHYRYAASNAIGTAFSPSSASFTTLPGEPQIANGAATDVLNTSATLAGTLTYEGLPPTTVYAFWATNDCGADAAAWLAAGASENLGQPEVDAPVSASPIGLAPNTVYHYNFMASNAIATAWGATNASPSFRTPGAPGLSGVGADLVMDISARLSGTLATGGDTRVYFTWGLAPDALIHTNDLGVVPMGACTANATGLSPLTTYYSRASAVNDYGEAHSDVFSFTTIDSVVSWTTVAAGLWTNPATWNVPGAPRAGATATVDHNVTLDASTPALACVTNNGTISFDGWDTLLSATNVTIAGTVTHAQNTATNAVGGVWIPNARVNIACGDLTLSGSGKIDVNYKGYRVGVWNYPGSGPGGGVYVSSAYDGYPVYGGGGGHGGVGGGFSESPLYNGIYGDFAAPENPGSGGGGGDTPGQPLKGHGGGAVRIAATGTVTLGGGGILANGEGQGYHMGAGSGGSVFITCRTLAGGASIQASGGPGGNAGGGGGRIAVVYDKTAQQAAPLPTTVFTAAGGKAGTGNVEFLPFYDGDIGTLYFPDSQFLTRQTGPIAHAGQWMAPDFTVWSRDALTFNNAWLRFASGFQLDVSNTLIVQGTDNRLHKLEVPSGDVSCGAAVVNKASLVMKADGAVAPSLVCSSFDVTNAAAFHVYAFATAAPETPGARVEVANAMTVGAASWVHPVSNPTNGASPEFLVGKLDVLAGSGFDASFRGYRGGPFASNGYGPGMGKGTGSGGGGGHGGSGGGFTALLCGITNDHSYAPIFAGSSGAGGGLFDMAYHSTGGWGGGEVRIRASGDVNLAGSLLANGGTG